MHDACIARHCLNENRNRCNRQIRRDSSEVCSQPLPSRSDLYASNIRLGDQELQPGTQLNPSVHTCRSRNDKMSELVNIHQRPSCARTQGQDCASALAPQQFMKAGAQVAPERKYCARRQHQATKQNRNSRAQDETRLAWTDTWERHRRRRFSLNGAAINGGDEPERNKVAGEGENVNRVVLGFSCPCRGLPYRQFAAEQFKHSHSLPRQRDELPRLQSTHDPFISILPNRNIMQQNSARGNDHCRINQNCVPQVSHPSRASKRITLDSPECARFTSCQKPGETGGAPVRAASAKYAMNMPVIPADTALAGCQSN